MPSDSMVPTTRQARQSACHHSLREASYGQEHTPTLQELEDVETHIEDKEFLVRAINYALVQLLSRTIWHNLQSLKHTPTSHYT